MAKDVKDVRSISAHEPLVKHAKDSYKLTTYRNYVKPFWPESDYYDKEALYIQLRALKEEHNQCKMENIKLKTKLQLCERDLAAYERVYSDINGRGNIHQGNQDKLLFQVKKLNKDLTQQLHDKNQFIETIKKTIKATKIQELETETKLLKEEVIRLREYIIMQETNLKIIEAQTQKQQDIQEPDDSGTQPKPNLFTRKHVTYSNHRQSSEAQHQKEEQIKSNLNNKKIIQENQDFKQKLQLSEEQVKSLKNEIAKLTTKNQSLEDAMSKLQSRIKEAELRKNKNSTHSFRSKQGTEQSQAQLKQKYQEELQFKLMLRGITHQQFSQMIAELKSQADDMKKCISKDDIEYILSQEPFQMTSERIKDIIRSYNASGHKLADQFLSSIGKYKTFYDFPSFSLDDSEQLIIQTLKVNFKKAQTYLLNKKQATFGREDITTFLETMNFGWNEPTQLLYLLNLFEKSKQKLEFEIQNILDPFPTIQQPSSRIVEESEEDYFDQPSDGDDIGQYEQVNEATEEQEEDSIQQQP